MAPKKVKETKHPRKIMSSEEEEEESHSSKPFHLEKIEREEDILDERDADVDEQETEVQDHPEPEPEVSLPAKRSLEKADDEVRKQKRSKTKDKKQTLFQRIFSEEDEVALLQGFLDFNSSKDKDGFYKFVKEQISFNASKRQVTDKLGKLKNKFANTVQRSIEKGRGGEETIVFSKAFEQKCFDLWRDIWGNEGVLASKSKKKLGEKQSNEAEIVSSPLSSGREVVSYLKAENVLPLGLDEATVLAYWNMAADGRLKRALEEKLKRVKAKQEELCSERITLVADTANLIFKEDNASSSSSGIKEKSGFNPSDSKRKLLVLDLNGLLADIVSLPADYEDDLCIGKSAIFKRPFCEDFLNFCFDKFEVGIWSSRKQIYVERITEFLLGDMKSKLLFCWDKSYCATTTVKSGENRRRHVTFKDLNHLWEKQDPKLPWKKGVYNKTNTVLLDVSPYKALLNPPYTAIFPHSYDHENKTDTSLGNGGDLRLYLERLVEAESIQDFIKKNPFGQEAITEASESWEIYSRAIRNHELASKKRSKRDDGEESFGVGSWEEKEVISREGDMKLQTNIILASIDQRSEQAAGESACTVLVAVIADWFQKNGNLMPSKSQFDSLIIEGSLEWNKLCEIERFMQKFPDKHFDLETVLQEKVVSSLTLSTEKSSVGFFHPDGMINEARLKFLQEALSFDSMWDEISLANGNAVYIVSWNDHFFVLKVENEAYYIIDTLGERLYEGCYQAYILKFDDKTIIRKNLQKDGSESEIVCRGKESCKEYIKSFLAAIPIRQLQEDIKKGLASNAPVHQLLQIEFHYTKMTTDAEIA